MVLVGIDEHDALEGSYFEILGVLECLKEEDLIFSSIRILNYLFYLLCSLFYGWNWEEFCDPGKSTSFHMIFLGMMKLDL